jgi:hypothetical protein
MAVGIATSLRPNDHEPSPRVSDRTNVPSGANTWTIERADECIA